MKEMQKEIDETIKNVCERIKDGNGMTGQEIDMINALAELVVARAFADYVSRFCADSSPVSDV